MIGVGLCSVVGEASKQLVSVTEAVATAMHTHTPSRCVISPYLAQLI